MVAAAERLEPRVVGRYAIYGEIASGGMASVHFARLAEPSGETRTVAVKRAHPHLARETDFALMFLDEARLASRIRHSNVVSTIDVLSTPDDLVLVMDYVHGESLWRLVRGVRERNERVPVPIAAAILIDTLHGLQAAHEATDEQGAPLGIVHRDVSPQNIMVGVDGVSRLVDFGIAKAVGRLHSTRDSSVKGKYGYMAPEQVRGEHVRPLTDTYAAAIVFWELLTGERLFAGKTEAETIHKALVSRVQAPSLLVPGLGDTLDDVLKKGLSREPARRYQTAREMAHDIEACVPPAAPAEVGAWVERFAGDALAARGQILADIERTEARRPRSRRRVMATAMLATFVGVAVLTALLVRHGPLAAALQKDPAPRTDTTVTASASASGSAPSASDAPGDPSVTTATVITTAPDTPASAATQAAASVPNPAPTPRSTPPVTRSSPRASPTRPSRPKHAACDPPYSIDSDGRQIFKPECM